MKLAVVALACMVACAHAQFNRASAFASFNNNNNPYVAAPAPVAQVAAVAKAGPVPVAARYGGAEAAAETVRAGSDINPDGSYNYLPAPNPDMAFPISGCLLIALVCVFVWWLLPRRAARVAASTPTLSGCLPVIGHAIEAVGFGDSVGALKYFQDLSNETNSKGGVAKGWAGPFLFYVITDPEDALTVLNACLKKHYVYRFVEPFIGQGLFVNRSVAKWKRHRKLLVPAFNQQILDGFMEVFNQQSRCLIERMAVELNNGPFDHWPYLGTNALETICRTAMGIPDSGQDLVTEEYGKACQDMPAIMLQRFKNFWLFFDATFKWSKLKAEQDKMVKVFQKMSNDVMEKCKRRMKDEEESRDNNNNEIEKGKRFKAFMDLLMELGAQGALTDKEIREQVDTMIIAGHDTSSVTLLFTLYILGAYPQVQERVYNELKEVFGTSNRDVTKDDLPKLVYMEAVLKESLRHFPVGPGLARYADKDVNLKNNCTIARGATIIVSVWGIHRNKCWGEDVDEFRPERWLEGGQHLNGALAAFSLGRRGCIGRTYAYMAMKTTLAHLLRQYRFSAEHDLQLKFEGVLKIHSGGKVAISLRKTEKIET